jgi:hypothetical protein
MRHIPSARFPQVCRPRCCHKFTVEHNYTPLHRPARPCGNTYLREEEQVRQFGEILKQVRIPAELAGKLAMMLRESQADKEKFNFLGFTQS